MRGSRSTEGVRRAPAHVVAALLLAVLLLGVGTLLARVEARAQEAPPYLVVLGIAQDGGVPQAGDFEHPGWTDPAFRRHVVSLGIVEPATGQRWLFEATPDLPRQLHRLVAVASGGAPASRDSAPAGPDDGPVLDGIFLTHAHMGHYTGLAHLGHEALGARRVPVHAMPRMAEYLRTNGPWSQLVAYGNVVLRELAHGVPVPLAARLTVTPFLVPHRQEYSEVVGFRIDGPGRSVLFLPDIDSWEALDARGTPIETLIAKVDVAYLDGTFYADGEIPGRDMSSFPHPFIAHSIERFHHLPAAERAKIRFIHLNHTNPALWSDTPARRAVEAGGFRIAHEGERVELR